MTDRILSKRVPVTAFLTTRPTPGSKIVLTVYCKTRDPRESLVCLQDDPSKPDAPLFLPQGDPGHQGSES